MVIQQFVSTVLYTESVVILVADCLFLVLGYDTIVTICGPKLMDQHGSGFISWVLLSPWIMVILPYGRFED